MSIELAFLHIPKTAGTSVMRALYIAFGAPNVLKVWSLAGQGQVEPNDFPAHELADNTAVVAGHLSYEQLIENPAFARAEPRIFSVVRDPVDRAISLFNYNRRAAPPADPLASFKGFAESFPPDRQWRYLTGGASSPFDLVDKKFVCTLENLQSGLTRAISTCRRPVPPLARLNVSGASEPPIIRRSEIPNDLIRIIKDRSALDLSLYHYARARERERERT